MNWQPIETAPMDGRRIEPPSSASPELMAALAADESNHINPLAHEQTR